MITGIGIDTIEISRFAAWHTKPLSQLRRILSEHEIMHCREYPHLSAQRFAVRFAAREAFFKALQATYPTQTLAFLLLCKSIAITHTPTGLPILQIDWQRIAQTHKFIKKQLKSHISLSHSHTIATALVILEKA